MVYSATRYVNHQIHVLLLLFLIIFNTGVCQSNDYSLDCKPKPGCHIAQCDPIPKWWGNIDNEDNLRRNEFPLTCEQKSGVSLKALMNIIARVDNDLKKTNKDMEQQYARVLASRETRIGRSESKMKVNRLQDIKNEIARNNAVNNAKNIATERRLKQSLTTEINNQMEIMNKTQEKRLEELEKAGDEKTTKAINDLRLELTGSMKRMEARLLKSIGTTIKNSLAKSAIRSTPKPVVRKPENPITRSPPTTKTSRTTATPRLSRSWTFSGNDDQAATTKSLSDDKYCKVRYNQFCYWVVTFSWKNIDIVQALKTCEGNGGVMADIHSKQHFDNVVDLVRKEINSIDEHIVVWLGMRVDAKTGDLYLKNGNKATFKSWFPGYPDTGSRFSDARNVYLYVQRNSNSRYQGMVNIQSTGKYPGVVCERRL